MADINKRLLTSSDGIPAPQHKVKGASEFEFTEGSGGAQHTKIVDSSGQPINIDDELKSIKRTQAEILDRLDNGIDTRVTGSIVERVSLSEEAGTVAAGSWKIINYDDDGKDLRYSNTDEGFVYFSLFFRRSEGELAECRIMWGGVNALNASRVPNSVLTFEHTLPSTINQSKKAEVLTNDFKIAIKAGDSDLKCRNLYLYKWRR